MNPWLSVITVVKDAPDDFSETVASILVQDLNGVEFVVVDSSTDRAAIPAHIGDAPALYSWTPPAGIYAAMNVGLAAATGQYAYFLNAGDTLAEQGVLARVGALLREERPTWAYGEVTMSDGSGRPVATPSWDYDAEQRTCFSRGHFPCHQGTFANRSVLVEIGGFDTSYRIVADYAAFLRLSTLARPVHIEEVVADFQPGGVSTTQWRQAIGEFHRARREILAPRGASAVREGAETALLFAKTAAYRTLWAEGRLGHGLVASLRGRG